MSGLKRPKGVLEQMFHDLRTPLSVILGNLQMLQAHWADLPAAKREELVTSALTRTEELDRTISDIDPAVALRRARLARLTKKDSDLPGAVEVFVTVDLGDECSLTGRSRGSVRDPAEERRAVAEATLNAIGSLLEVPIAIDGTDILKVGSARLAVVSVVVGEQILIGSAEIRSADDDALARAVLDALNRFLAPVPMTTK